MLEKPHDRRTTTKKCTRNKHAVDALILSHIHTETHSHRIHTVKNEKEPHSVTKQFARFFVVSVVFVCFVLILFVWLYLEFCRLRSQMYSTLCGYVFHDSGVDCTLEWCRPMRCDYLHKQNQRPQWFFRSLSNGFVLLSLDVNLNCVFSLSVGRCLFICIQYNYR